MALAAQAAAADGIDTVLVLADNNFSSATFDSIERLKFGGKATATFAQDIVGNPQAIVIGDGNANSVVVQLKNTAGKVPGVDLSGLTFQSWTDGIDKVVVRGTKSQDIITGSSRGDVIAGGEGRDSLQGGNGADAFVFDSGMGKGVDQIADFSRKQGDMIWIDLDVFAKLKSAVAKGSGTLKKSAFEKGRKADDKKDRILYDKKDGALRYDDDGSRKHKAHVIAVLDDSPALKAGDIFVI
jgi:Ca2+-binding RTX toxin-like protein